MSTTSRGTTVKLPKLGESVIEGTIGSWLKQVGEQVEKYDPLVEVTTDKVNAEVPSPVSGVIAEIRAQEGDTLPVGAELCIIAEEGEGASASTGAGVAEAPTDGHAVAEMPRAAATQNGAGPAARERGERRRGAAGEIELLRTRSSPAVRRIAEEHGVDISRVQGTGLGGRVTKQDILAYVDHQQSEPETAEAVAATTAPTERQAVAAADQAIEETVALPGHQPPTTAAPQPSAPPRAPRAAPAPVRAVPGRLEIPLYEGDEVSSVSVLRKQIAENVARSERIAPHVTLWMEVDMSGVVAARQQAKERFAREEGFELTYLPFVIKAVVHALREHPRVNSVWDEERIIHRKAINIGVAVGMEDGLIVPVIKQADEKSIAGLARSVRDLAARARAGRLGVDEVQGGTFTVNNPGTYGTVLSTPIIVQPQSAILSTEAIVKRPVVVEDSIAIRPIMNLSLSIDHRILDGLAAARFLATVKRWLEEFRPDTPLY